MQDTERFDRTHGRNNLGSKKWLWKQRHKDSVISWGRVTLAPTLSLLREFCGSGSHQRMDLQLENS